MRTIRTLVGGITLTLVAGDAGAAEPERVWGTYVGGESSDSEGALAVDETGSIYLAGVAYSTTGIATPGAHKAAPQSGDAFLVKFDPAGKRLWGTYFGGESNEGTWDVAARDGKVVIAGYTLSQSGVATPDAFATSRAGTQDGFVACFSDAGVLLWATYVGGSGAQDHAQSVAFADQGDVYAAGRVTLGSAIAGPGAHQPSLGGGAYDGYLLRLDDQGQRVWGTFYGGSATDTAYAVAVGPGDTVYLGGQTTSTTNIASAPAHQSLLAGSSDGFLARFDGAGMRLWGTYFGGAGQEVRVALAAHPDGGVVMGTHSNSPGLATPGVHQTAIAGLFDGVVARFDAAGQRLWSTYHGGEDTEDVNQVAIGPDGSIYVSGETVSTTGVATPDAWQTMRTALNNNYAAKLTAAGQRVWGTYYGGPGGLTERGRLALHGNDVILAGQTTAPTGMATPGAHKEIVQGNDTYLARFEQAGNDGAACVSAAGCSSGHCVDGVCCDAACGDADPGDCQACSIAAGAAMNGVCGPRAPATCRPPVDACDAAEACDGVSLQCPADAPASDGTPCEGGLCESGLCTPQGDTSTTAPSTTGETTSTTSTTSSATAATTGETTPPALTTSDSTVSSASNSGSGSGGDDPTTNAGTTLDAPTGDPQPDDTTGTTSAPPRGTDAGCGCRTAAPAPALALLLLALSRRRPRDPR